MFTNVALSDVSDSDSDLMGDERDNADEKKDEDDSREVKIQHSILSITYHLTRITASK